jgi:hypothetical protein
MPIKVSVENIKGIKWALSIYLCAIIKRKILKPA